MIFIQFILILSFFFTKIRSAPCDNCYECPVNVCVNCTVGYSLNTMDSLCSVNTNCSYMMGNCLTCETHDWAKCITCNPKYYLNGDVCSACFSGQCKICPGNVCVDCMDGWTLDTSMIYCTQTCKSGSNCETCATYDYTACLTCQMGSWMISPFNCSSCSDENCANCPSDSCTDCNNGYTLNTVSGVCQANTNCDAAYNCATCKTDDYQKCISCLSNFHRNSNDDTCNVGCLPSSNCLENNCLESWWGECTACAGDYYFDGEFCLECVNNCYNCTDIDVCTSCVGGFHLNNTVCEDDCEPTKNCATDACLMEDWSLCTDCIGGYFLNGGVCVDHCNPASNCYGVYCDASDWSVCTQCPAGKWLNESHCNNNCDITCERCDGGASTDCVTCKTNAAEYDNSGSCTCKSGFYGEPNNCLACDLTCVTCDGPEETDCLTCFGDATLESDGTCVKNGPGNTLSGAETAGIVIGVLIGVLLLLLLIFIVGFFILKRTGVFSDSKNEKAELDLSSLLSSPQEKDDDAKK